VSGVIACTRNSNLFYNKLLNIRLTGGRLIDNLLFSSKTDLWNDGRRDGAVV